MIIFKICHFNIYNYFSINNCTVDSFNLKFYFKCRSEYIWRVCAVIFFGDGDIFTLNNSKKI